MVPAVRLTGTVAEIHARDPFTGPEAVAAPTVLWCDFTDAALVLGSAQRDDVVDTDALARDGVPLVRRRSGGGAVLLEPGSVVWIDLAVPAGTPGWPDDVRASMVAAGDVWAAALGLPGLHVHASMDPTAWSPLVCFAGLGPGEVVTAGGAKLVGLSQRRTRHGARIQGLVHRRALVVRSAGYIAAPRRPSGAPPEAATLRADPGALASRLAAALSARLGPGPRAAACAAPRACTW